MAKHRVAEFYSSLDENLASQDQFDSRSVLAALYTEGLHESEDDNRVDHFLSLGAPLDGVKAIEYGDNFIHYEVPLLTALVDERWRTAECLLARGANADAPNLMRDRFAVTGFVHTALHMMAARNSIRGLKILLNAGADINAQTTSGTTSLHFAYQYGFRAIIDELRRWGAKTDIPEFVGDRETVDQMIEKMK